MSRLHTGLVTAVAAWGLAGCASGPAPKATSTQARLYSLYPLPPAAPHVQFLTQFAKIEDLTGSRRSEASLAYWLLGPEDPLDDANLIPKKPFGIAAVQDKLYVTDSSKGRVIVYDLANARQYALDRRGLGKLIKPVDIFVEPGGYIFVADIARGAIIVYDASEHYVTAFGKPGQFTPAAITVYGNEVIVADVKGGEVEVLDRSTGALKRVIGTVGREPGHFNAPTSVGVSNKGELYVTDTFNYRVQKFGPTGKFLNVIGEVGRVLGTFHRPKGLALTANGWLCVTDAAFEAVEMFDEKGRILMSFGSPAELLLPARLTCDARNVKYFNKYAHPNFAVEELIFVTSNFGPYPVTVYGLGHLKDPSKPIGMDQLKPVPTFKSDVPTLEPGTPMPTTP